jgi:hypothetical protein
VVSLQPFHASRAAPLWFGEYTPAAFAPPDAQGPSRDLGEAWWEDLLDAQIDETELAAKLADLASPGELWLALDGLMAGVAAYPGPSGRRRYGPLIRVLDALDALEPEGDRFGIAQLYRAAAHSDVDGNTAAGHLSLDAIYALIQQTDDPMLLRAAGHALVTVPIHDYYVNAPHIFLPIDEAVEDPIVRHALAQFALREALVADDPSWRSHWSERLVETAAVLGPHDHHSLLDPPTPAFLEQTMVTAGDGMAGDFRRVLISTTLWCARNHKAEGTSGLGGHLRAPLVGHLEVVEGTWSWARWSQPDMIADCIAAKRDTLPPPDPDQGPVELLILPEERSLWDLSSDWWDAYCNGHTGLATCD